MKEEKGIMIGMLGYTQNNSWVPRILEELHEGFKQNITHFGIDQLRDQLGPLIADKHMKYKKLYPLSHVLKGHEHLIDLLIVEESYIWFKNDLKIPVLYYHTEPHMPFTVKYPTHVLYKNPDSNDFLHSLEPWGWKSVKWKTNLYPAAHPPFWFPDYPKDVQCTFIGAPSDMFDRKRDWMWNLMQQSHWEIVQYLKGRHFEGLNIIDDEGDDPVDHRTYNEFLARSKHMVLTAYNGATLGRRHIECLASKCIPIIWVENDHAERCLRSLGFIPYPERNCTCYFYRKPYELDDLVNREYDPQMAQRGHECFMNNHTFRHRALTLMKLIERTCRQLKTETPPFEGVFDEFKYKFREVSRKRLKT